MERKKSNFKERERDKERRESNSAFLNWAKLISARLEEGRRESRKIQLILPVLTAETPWFFLCRITLKD